MKIFNVDEEMAWYKNYTKRRKVVQNSVKLTKFADRVVKTQIKCSVLPQI